MVVGWFFFFSHISLDVFCPSFFFPPPSQGFGFLVGSSSCPPRIDSIPYPVSNKGGEGELSVYVRTTINFLSVCVCVCFSLSIPPQELCPKAQLGDTIVAIDGADCVSWTGWWYDVWEGDLHH